MEKQHEVQVQVVDEMSRKIVWRTIARYADIADAELVRDLNTDARIKEVTK